MSRQEIRRAVREIKKFSGTAESAKRTVTASMTQMRVAASGWFELIETIERTDPEAARRIPEGLKEECLAVVELSRQSQLTFTETLEAMAAVHASIVKLAEELERG